MRVLIIGYGNPLRSDDGLGWHVAQQLSTLLQSSDVEVIAQQQLTPELAETASHFERILFIDAARDLPPGQLRCEKLDVGGRLAREAQPSGYAHFLTPASLLAWTAELYSKFPEAYCLSVGGESFAEGEILTSAAQGASQPLLEKVRSLIALPEK